MNATQRLGERECFAKVSLEVAVLGDCGLFSCWIYFSDRINPATRGAGMDILDNKTRKILSK
jgi:hypothetical protein